MRKPIELKAQPAMTSMNISTPEAVKLAIAQIPSWEHPSASAYFTSLAVKDLLRRKLLKLEKH